MQTIKPNHMLKPLHFKNPSWGTFSLFIVSLLLNFQTAFSQITGNATVCEGDKETYYAPSGGSSYLWSSITGGNVQSAINTDSIIIQWGAPGTGTMVVTVNNVTFYSLNVTINPKPNPVITHAPYPTCPVPTNGVGTNPDDKTVCEKVCKNATITYTTTLNAGSSYLWVATGASSLSGANTNTATVTWNNASTGSLIVYETNSFGCVDSFALCIEKVDLPIANFSNSANVCLNATTYFTNLSSGATSYQWFFGDGGNSTQVNPSHAYNTAGTYTITLIATNDCFCKDTFQSTITVSTLPGPDITCPSTVCADETSTYSTSAVGAGCVYNWFVQGGTIVGPSNQQTVTIMWGPGQIGYVGLIITGCGNYCSDTTWVQVPIVPLNGTIAGPNKVCPGECHKYSLPLFSGATYTWSFTGNCGIISDTVCCEEVEICWQNIPTACNDTLQVAFYDSFLNCGGTASMVIKLRPVLKIGGNDLACSNGTSFFFNFIGANCIWNVSPAGPIYVPGPSTGLSVNWNNLPGNYIISAVTVNPNNSCNDTAFYQVKVVAPPIQPVITGDTLVCPNSSVQYCATGSNVYWLITGGTPANANGNCVTVNWGSTPPFIVRAYDKATVAPFCNSDTTLQNVYPFSPSGPINLSGPSIVCANSTTNFFSTNVFPAGTTYSWVLSVPNSGTVVSGQGTPNIQIEWGNNAPQTVTLTFNVKICGINYLVTKNIQIRPVPTPTVLQANNFCQGSNTTLSATGGVFTAYQWSGPSGYISITSPTTITLAGLYQVTVTDGFGCTALSQKIVQYVNGPIANISTGSPTTFCLGSPINTTICALGNPNYNYSWSNAATTQCITVNAVGSYQVTVTDNTNNCFAISNTISVTQVNCVPDNCVPDGTVSFTNTGCNPIAFNNTSVNAISSSWNFGDNTSSNLTSPTHQYLQAGFYYVTLSCLIPNATNTDTCLVQFSKQVEVPLAPRFNVNVGCYDAPVCFTDISTYTAGNNITSWSWNFGDANTSPLQSPCHTYSVGGTYIVSLTISNGTCNSTFLDTINVLPAPTAAFTFSNPNCINTPVPFTDASFASINYWNWNFGNSGTSLNQNPNSSYTSANTYNVTLIVHDIFGCYDTVINPITIVAPSISGNINAYPDTVVCAGTSVLLVAPPCPTCSYLWSNNATNDSITVTSTGIYAVTITDANGCAYSTFIKIIVNNGPPAIISNSGKDEFCFGKFTQLSVASNINWLYSWSSNDANVNGSVFSTVVVSPASPGVYNYQVIINDTSTGCSDTSLPYIITVFPNPVPPTIVAIGSTTVCDGDTIILVASHPDPTVTFQWNTGAVNDTLLVTKNGCYTVVATDSNDCSNSAPFCVTVNPLPDLCSFYEGCYDTCAPYIINGPAGNSSYLWLLNGTSTGVTTQNYVANMSGLYSVVVTNSFGCIDTTGVLDLTVYPCPDSLCAEVILDSIYCDANGDYVMNYQVVNLSQIPISEVLLQILPPNLSVAYSPNLNLVNVLPGDTSIMLTATIFNANAGDVLCFVPRMFAYDSMGMPTLCCKGDTICVTLPPCAEDTFCCRFNLVSQSIICKKVSNGNQYDFFFTIDGCGLLQIDPPNLPNIVYNQSNPYQMTNGLNTLSGSYFSNTNDSVLCLTFVVSDSMQFCKDTTICFKLPPCDTLICDYEYDDVICEGQSTTYQYNGNTVGVTISWTFAGGTPATASGAGPHTVTYANAGNYIVSMTLSNSLQTVKCLNSISVISKPIATISQNGNMLYAGPSGYLYQWYELSPNYTLLPGETNQFYSPINSTLYCVIVSTEDGCKDTACIDFVPNGIIELQNNQWEVYPNPNEGSFILSLHHLMNEEVTMKIYNALGEIVDGRNLLVKNNAQQFNISNKYLSTGVYMIHLKTKNGVGYKKMVVK